MPDTRKPLDGQVAIVTGSSRRIGARTAERLAADGAAVVVNGVKNASLALEVASGIEAKGGRAIVAMGDVTDEETVKGIVDKAVASFGRLDIVVNNAAVRPGQTLEDISFDDWKRILAIVLDGAFLTAKYAAPHLIETKGAIVNVGGLAAMTGATRAVHVAAAKTGLIGLTRSLANQLGPKGVRVNLVSPGIIEAPDDPPEERARRGGPDAVRRIPMGHSGETEDIANVIAALVGPDCRYVTGQTVHVNGGAYMG